MRSFVIMLGMIACLPIAAQEITPLPAPPEPEAVDEPREPSPLQDVASDDEGITRLVVDDTELVQGTTGLAHVEGVSLKDYAIKENVRIQIYPPKGIRPVPSVNPITKGVDIMLLADQPGSYFLVFAMAREGRLIYLAAPITVRPKK